ncbi:MAG: citrate synthase/methylcitrate synthase [Acidobacteria bacterium]|nr:citrate synthase/methylcitrate synthase [Acidobacteriota bacterium]
MTTTLDVPKGLKGLAVADTEVGDVRGDEGFYHYRQYSAVELAEKRTFEDVWYLLLEGELPDEERRRQFMREVAPLRTVPRAIEPLLDEVARTCLSPLSGLRTVLSHLAAVEAMPASHGADRSRLLADARRLTSVAATVVAALHRRSRGLEPIAPDDALPYAANYLFMVNGQRADERHARAIEQYLMLAVDHGFNASTFTARVVTSTGADFGAAVVAALGALSGPLHGGAPSLALESLDAIGTPDRAPSWVRDAVARGERIMGFGHAVYRTKDPRSEALRGTVEELGGPRAELAVQVERLVEQTLAELKPDRPLQANIEFYAGVLMEQCGLPPELFTPTFAIARVVGWCAQALEQAADVGIIRPSARYIGPPPPQPVPAA